MRSCLSFFGLPPAFFPRVASATYPNLPRYSCGARDKFEVYLRFEAETMIKYTNIISEQNKSDGGRLPQKPELKEKSQDHPLTPPSKHQDNLLKLKQVSQGQEADLEEAKE